MSKLWLAKATISHQLSPLLKICYNHTNMNIGDLTQNQSPRDAELIAKAYDFAQNAHQGQKRESGEEYFSHPFNSAKKLAELKLDSITIAAALLHDVVDDTSAKIEEIQKEFGKEIANLVEGVSKLGKVKYQGIERYAENLRKFFLAMSKDLRVVLIKLADRMHNMETIQYLPQIKQTRIAKETLEIYAPIANRLGMGQIKGQLEELAFPVAYPNEYKKTLEIYNAKKETQSKYVEKAKRILIKKLVKYDIDILEVHGRVKYIYSFFKKLEKFSGNPDLIFDIIALRVLVKDTKDCYSALGITHNIWKPLPNKIKDYIALPKPNGYKSLHTTVFGPDGVTIEIQIRTPEMHKEAELGIAAHWFYDDSKKQIFKSKNHSVKIPKAKEIKWIQQLAEFQEKNTGTQEFLDNLKIDFFSDRIFVLTPRGDVIDLPEGATPLDFAFKIHSYVGCRCIGAKANHKIVPLDYRLQNGEIVEILTKENSFPKKRWLEIVKTSEARTKLRNALKKIN